MLTKILQHDIDFNWDEGEEDRELCEIDIEHIKKQIEEGYQEGELCQTINEEGDEVRGWWKIIKN